MQNKLLQLESFGISHIGLVRDHNEDAWQAFPEQGLFVVADGMGGHAAGEIAAQEAVATLVHLFEKNKNKAESDAKAFFKEAYTKVNAQIFGMAAEHDELHGMGTTLCSLYLYRQEALLAHVGDSRIYRLRARHLDQLTEDHSLVAELLSSGSLSRSSVESFPYKNILTRAIGTQPHVESALKKIAIESNDLFLLCSDGLSNYVHFDEIQESLAKCSSLSKTGEALVDLALKQGGGDNVTLLLVKVF